MAMAGGGLLLAACGGDTVKIFDTAPEQSGDPCLYQYTPSPDFQLNSVVWNHTNMVVASAGDDRKISLWTQRLQSVVTIASDPADSVEESIMAINFSTKSSRYLCSGGTGKVVRVWDMQRKRCIKWLKGHSDTITSAMYNCKDEHVASVSLGGDLILHNLASGSRIAELKDPHRQVLRVLEFSRLSRHLLVTSGDDGSVHLWDTTGRSPKVSWIKQHLAPTTGVCFSPPNDKIIASVGLDKKLYIFDVNVKRPVHALSCETPFSTATFRDDGGILAAGTNDGRVVFYDIRNGVKPQASTALRAYGPSKVLTSLSWQRSNPVYVNEKAWTMEMALLGPVRDDPVIMPDPLPASTGSRKNVGRSNLSTPNSAISRPLTGNAAGEETPSNHLITNGNISRLHILRSDLISSKDDMDVFSPLVDVQPIVPSATKQWDFGGETKKDFEGDGFLKFSSGGYKLSSREHSPGLQDELSKHSPVSCTPPAAVKENRSPSVTPPEAWGGESGGTDRNTLRLHTASRFASGTTSASAALSGHVDTGRESSSVLTIAPTRSPVKTTRVDTDPDPLSLESSYSDSLVNRRDWKEDRTDEIRENGMDLRLEHPGGTSNGQAQGTYKRSPQQQGPPAFALQLVQRALEESLNGVQKSIHEDVQNLHLELLRQFHIHQGEMNALIQKVLARQDELMEEVQALRRENQQLLQYL